MAKSSLPIFAKGSIFDVIISAVFSTTQHFVIHGFGDLKSNEWVILFRDITLA